MIVSAKVGNFERLHFCLICRSKMITAIEIIGRDEKDKQEYIQHVCLDCAKSLEHNAVVASAVKGYYKTQALKKK